MLGTGVLRMYWMGAAIQYMLWTASPSMYWMGSAIQYMLRGSISACIEWEPPFNTCWEALSQHTLNGICHSIMLRGSISACIEWSHHSIHAGRSYLSMYWMGASIQYMLWGDIYSMYWMEAPIQYMLNPDRVEISGFFRIREKWRFLKTSTSRQNWGFSRILHVETYPWDRFFHRRQNAERLISKLTAVPKPLKSVLGQCLSVKTLARTLRAVRFAKMSSTKSRFLPEMA